MTAIRQMRADDVEAARQIDAAAFGAWRRQAFGETEALAQRTCTNVLSIMGKDPEGCFVAEEEGRVVGLIFSRTWGGVGWFGTFAVLPDYQGRGIGQQLIAASLDYLRRDRARLIGLETMPESPNNVGLYLRMGFRPRFLTLVLHKQLSPPVPHMELGVWSSADAETQRRWLADLRQATGLIYPGLDYTKEIISTAAHELGETLVLVESETAVGFSTLWLKNARESSDDLSASVQVMALHPAYADQDRFGKLVAACEAMAAARGRQSLLVPVNASHEWALDRLRQAGYRVARAMVRMVLDGTEQGPVTDRHVDCSRWAG